MAEPPKKSVGDSFGGFWIGASSNPLAAGTFVVIIAALTLIIAELFGALYAPQLRVAVANIGLFLVALGLLLRWIIGQLVRLAWPQVALICFALAIASARVRRGLSSAWKRAQKLKWGGVEIELSQETAKELAASAEDAFKSYRLQANRFIRHQVSAFDVRTHLETTIANPSLVGKTGQILSAPGFRCTLYIRDVLFEDTLYQLVDYYPWDGNSTAGRAFSSRFGIIGRAWRSGQHLGEATVPTDEDVLVRDWGMTKEEARRGSRNRPAYICSILRTPGEAGAAGAAGTAVAVLFADSTEVGAFGSKDQAAQLAQTLARVALETELSVRLKDLRNELNKYSAAIETHH
jgi:hypothetical protein